MLRRANTRRWTLGLLLIAACILAMPAWAQNPFTGKPSPPEQTRSLSKGGAILEKTTIWQQKIRRHMAEQIETARTDRSLRPLMLMFMLAMGYGILHAAGPGHGKAVALSYMLARRASLSDTLAFGVLVSAFHGLSAIVSVLVVQLILSGGMRTALDDITRITQLVSFSLIFAMGMFLFVQALRRWIRHGNENPDGPAGFLSRQKGPLAAAAAVGIIPCPGVVMVMLFSLSMELLWLGIVLGFAITAGMALTIGAAVLVGVGVKNVSLGAVQHKSGHFEHLVHCVAGLMVAVLGGLFLASVII
jgi:nickel/cobalt transporter (NicO) family protein